MTVKICVPEPPVLGFEPQQQTLSASPIPSFESKEYPVCEFDSEKHLIFSITSFKIYWQTKEMVPSVLP